MLTREEQVRLVDLEKNSERTQEELEELEDLRARNDDKSAEAPTDQQSRGAQNPSNPKEPQVGAS